MVVENNEYVKEKMRTRLFRLIKSKNRLLDAPCRLALLSAQRLANDGLASLLLLPCYGSAQCTMGARSIRAQVTIILAVSLV